MNDGWRVLLLLFKSMTQLALVELCIDHTSHGVRKRNESEQEQSSSKPAHGSNYDFTYDLTRERSSAAQPNEIKPIKPTIGASPAVRGSSGAGGGLFSAI